MSFLESAIFPVSGPMVQPVNIHALLMVSSPSHHNAEYLKKLKKKHKIKKLVKLLKFPQYNLRIQLTVSPISWARPNTLVGIDDSKYIVTESSKEKTVLLSVKNTCNQTVSIDTQRIVEAFYLGSMCVQEGPNPKTR